MMNSKSYAGHENSETSFQAQMAARRQQILTAAVEVFAEMGFSRATIKDIAGRADVADGTIYNYFENKNALLFALLHELNESEARPTHFQSMESLEWTQFFRSYLQHRMQVVGGEKSVVLQVLLAEMLVNAELRDQYFQQVLEPTTRTARQAMQAADVLAPDELEFLLHVLPGTLLGLQIMRILGDSYIQTHWDMLSGAIAEMFLAYLQPDSTSTTRALPPAATTMD